MISIILKWLEMKWNDVIGQKKGKRYGRTGEPTDQQTDRAGHRVACTRLKRMLDTKAEKGEIRVDWHSRCSLFNLWVSGNSQLQQWNPSHWKLSVFPFLSPIFFISSVLFSRPSVRLSLFVSLPFQSLAKRFYERLCPSLTLCLSAFSVAC